MTKDVNTEIGMEELSDVAGGSKNVDNPVVKTVIDAFQAVKDRPLQLARSSGCLGAADGRFGPQ